MIPEAGEIIDGKYRILRMLGQGGMGAVFEGENTRIKRRVAIKLLHASVSSQAEVVTRFEREAQAAAHIGSDHICEVLDLGVLADGTRYMVMEYLDGETLGSRIQRTGPMVPEQTIPVMSQILDALGAAHAAGIIHRDLKPDNVFLLKSKAGIRDFIKILDFGVSKFSQLSGDEMNMTRAGAVVGTPYYMSPEQARGMSEIDARSDIYALGVLLYEATTGQVPFQAQTFNELLFKIVLEPVPPPQSFVPELDPVFAAIVQRAMAREPAHRFQCCAEFKDALLQFLSARPSLSAQSPALQATAAMRPPRTQALEAMQTLVPSPSTPAPAMTWPSMPPQRTLLESSWAGTPGNSSQAAVPQTSNAWGAASAVAAQPPKPPSKAPVIAAALGTILLLGAAVGAWLVFGRTPSPSGQSASSSIAAPTPPETALAQPPETVAPMVEIPAPKPAETALAASAAPTASAAPIPQIGRAPAPTGRMPPTSTGKTRATSPPKDPGY